MNSKNKVIITYGLYMVDMLCIAVSFILATYMRFHNFKDMGDKTSHFIVGLIFVLLATLYTFVVPWHNLFMTRSLKGELWHIVKMNMVMVLATQFVMFFMKWADTFSRWVMVYFLVIDIAFIFIAHIIFKQAMKVYYTSDHAKTKVMVITDPDLKETVSKQLSENLEISYQIISTLTTDEITDDFYNGAQQIAMDEVFIYTPDWQQDKVNRIVKYFDDMGVVCNYCVELPNMDNARSNIGTFGSFSVMTYNHFQKSYKRLLVKRFMDILGGLVGCIITIIFTPFVALAIKLDSKGPVFFSQIRMGRNGRRFKIWKFRSMYIDAEERKKELEAQSEVEGLMFKMENDPRITKVGRFIRKTSIDELPQFFNILKGDMSLVGTRPPTVDEFEKYNEYYRRRLSMTPGLTGMWQVSGRSDITDFDDVVKLDLKYIDEWSLGLDIKILLKTIKVVFTGEGSK